MRKLSTIFAVLIMLLVANTWVSAQVLSTENFNYNTGDSLTSHGWLAHSGVGTNVETITTGLTYTGYIGSGIGGSSTLTTTGQDVNKTWASYPNGITSGNIYYSLMVELDSAQTAGDYFFHFFKNSSTFPARLYARKAVNSNTFSFGIMKGSTFANVAWSDSIYTFGTTYLIVVKYAFVPGTSNDTVALWINPNISGSTEPTPTVFETAADKAIADYDTVYGVAIRQGTATSAPRGKVDGIRVAQSWRSVNNMLAVLSKNTITFTNTTLGSAVKDSVIVSNNDATSLTVSSVTSGNSVFGVSPISAIIVAGGSQKFIVTYTPTATVTSSSAIVFTSNAASSPDSVYVSGNAVTPGFTISTRSYNFGNVYTNTTAIDSVTVTNALASGSLNITSVTSSNPLYTVGPASGSLATGASMKFGVSFTPTAAGIASSSIAFFNNGGLVSDTLKVSGNGIVKAPGFSVTPALKNYHGVLAGHSWKDSVTVKNTGYDSLKITGVTSSDPTFTVTPTTAQLDTQATKKFYITFSPTAVGAKSASIVFANNATTVGDTVVALGKGASWSTIAQARVDSNGDLIPDHSITGDTLFISGVITSKNLQSVGGQTAIFIQDSTAGVEIFGYSLPPVTMVIGDSVFAMGTVAQYHGGTEFEPLEPTYDVIDSLHFGILKHNAAVPKPKRLTLHQYVANAESYEGLLIEIDTLYKASGTWPSVLTSAALNVTNASRTDTTELYISSSTDIGGSIEPAYPINVVGIVNQYSSGTTLNNGYELEPSDSSNITHTKFASLVKISEARKDLNNDLIADHSVTKDTLEVSGVITSTNLQSLGSQTAIFIQDSTAGIEIFNYSLPPVTMVIGDSVFVIGTVSQYRGAVEFTPLANDTLHFGISKHKATVPKPKHLTLHQFVANAESYEGLLVEIDTLYKASGTWPGAATGAAIYVTNSSKADTAELYISSSTDIGGSVEKAYPINVTAVINQYSSASTVYNNGYEIEPSDTSNIVHQVVTRVDEAFSGIPTSFVLENNYPNPFNPTTTILYGIVAQSHVTVKVYSVLGQEIATLVNDVQSPSYYRVMWNGTNASGNMVSSGVYFYRITAAPVDGKSAPFSQVKKMLLMK